MPCSKTVNNVPKKSKPHFLNSVTNKPSSDFSIYGHIGSTPGLIIFDSGAQVSLVDKQVGFGSIENTDFSIRGITGASLPIYGIVNEEVSLGQHVKFNCNLVVTDLPEGYIGILGLDVMEKEKIDLLVSRKSIKVQGKEIFTTRHNQLLTEVHTSGSSTNLRGQQGQSHVQQGYQTPPSLDKHCLLLYSSGTVTLPSRSEVVISAKLGKVDKSISEQLECTDVLIEPQEVNMHGVYVASTLTCIKQSKCVVKLVNCSKEELTLNTNTVLGRLTNPILKVTTSNATVFQVKEDNHFNETFKAILEEKLRHLTFEDKQKLENVIYEYQDIFSIDESGNLGCTSAVTHKIDTGNTPPIKKRPYRIPHSLKPVVKDLIEKQLKEDIIVPSNSAWSAPIIVLPKKIGEDGIQRWRCVVDYRELNEVTTPIIYPIPEIREVISTLSGSKYFSALDMNQGYYQIKMDPASQEKTAFTVPDGDCVGTYEYVRMPLGLRNAPSTFQRFMDTTLAGLRGKSCLIYLDDCLLYASNIDAHVEDLRSVLQRFRDVNLSVKLQKCRFAMEEIEYLGHTLNQKGVRPLKKKIEAVENYPQPKTVREVRGFLGLSGYYRRHIPNYASIAKPLTQLTKKDTKFMWSEECENSFNTLKNALVSEPLLTYPDFSKPFMLSTDASSVALGAILSNVIDGKEHPIAYASRQLSKSEMSYTVTELELLAVIWAVKYFRCYLIGVHFTLVTDHSAIKWLLSLKDTTSRLTRWALKLAQYNYTVIHKPGKQHLNVDALSRVVYKTNTELLPVIDLDVIRDEQRKDVQCQQLKKQPRFKTSPQGVIYHNNGDDKQILVPQKLRQKIIQLHHNLPSAGHAACRKTLERIKHRFVWPNMKDDINQFVRQCHSCNQRRDYGKCTAPLGTFNEPDEVFQRISCDIVGPLPVTKSGNRYILSVTDHFSRYTEFIALPDQASENVARALVQRFITKYGVPKELLTDQGGTFTGELIAHICKLFKIKKIQTTGYHPMSNGRSEITHKTLSKMLSHYVNKNQNDWDNWLCYVCMAYNTQYHESLGYSPYEIVFGRRMETPLEANLDLTDSTERLNDHVETLRSKLAEIKQLTQQHQTKMRNKQKRCYDKKTKQRQYEAGQLVYLFVPAIKRHRVKKLSKLWRGPYKIIRVISDLNVVVRVRGKDVVVHVNRIKPVIRRNQRNTHLEADESTQDSDNDEQAEVEGVNHPESEPQPGPSTRNVAAGESHVTDAIRCPRIKKLPKRLQDYEIC